MLLEPKNFAGRKARQHRIAQLLDRPFQAAQFLGYLQALRRCGGVAPKFGRTNHLALLIQGDESMLLTAHANRLDLSGAGTRFRHRPLNRLSHRFNPI